MAHAVKRNLRYEDLANMPDDGLTREIWNGALVVTPSPSPVHQRVSKRLQRQLEAYFERHEQAEVFNAPLDTIVGPHDVLEPDLLVVTDRAMISDRAIEGVPALVVEILSPSSAARDRMRKTRRYAAAGVRHCWLVDPGQQRIECLRLEDAAYVVVAHSTESETLVHPDWPDLVIDAGALWR